VHEPDEWPEKQRGDADESVHPGDRKPKPEPKTRRILVVPASELKRMDMEGDWLWDGCLAKGTISLLCALWKAGKTTLLGHFLRETLNGGMLCGLAVKPCRVLIISEEPDGLWADRRDKLGIQDNVHFVIRHFKAKPSLPDWLEFVAGLAELVREDEYGAVILDPISAFWPVVNENDAGEMMAALLPLRSITDAGAAVGLFHHPRKSGGNEATAIRGSGALPGFVDTILELRRYDPINYEDRRRVITGSGRFEATPREVVIELSEDGQTYSTCGNRSEIGRMDRLRIIAGMLSTDGMTVKEVHAEWPGEPVPSQRTLANDLRYGASRAKWAEKGTGKRNDPFKNSPR
jgi:hypothetical protein